MSRMRQPVVAICGPSAASEAELSAAAEVGRGLAQAGLAVATGGLEGVMEAALRGAREARGVTIGVLPGDDPEACNRFVTVAIACGNGQGRNAILVQTADAVVAIGKSPGTLSEVAFALRLGRPVITLGGYGDEIDPAIRVAQDAAEAYALAAEAARG